MRQDKRVHESTLKKTNNPFLIRGNSWTGIKRKSRPFNSNLSCISSSCKLFPGVYNTWRGLLEWIDKVLEVEGWWLKANSILAGSWHVGGGNHYSLRRNDWRSMNWGRNVYSFSWNFNSCLEEFCSILMKERCV